MKDYQFKLFLGLLKKLQPEKFVNLGIEPPKGVLLFGPPGTGKTLCARAVANRTDACFIRVIGSELVQKYVGEVSCKTWTQSCTV
jgi:26S proteasome regulatory subunit T1